MELMRMLPESEPKPVAARVLLVEDEVTLRLWIAEELRDAGFTVIEAKNADEASAIIASGSPVDLIFSDVRMPGSMNGLEFARRVRARYPTLPIIITSGDLGPGGTGGLGRLLKKPYSVAQAIALLSEALGRSRPDGGP
jgi:two-component system, response regulator PdtaR